MDEPITRVSLEISDDVPAPQRRIPTLVIRTRLGPRQVTVVEDTMIVGLPTEPRIVLPAPEPEPAPDPEPDPSDSAVQAIIIKHGPNIPAMVAAIGVCFAVSVFGSMMVSIHINEPEPQQISAPLLPEVVIEPPVEERVEPARRQMNAPPSQVERAKRSRPSSAKKKTERKFNPLRSKVIFRASDI